MICIGYSIALMALLGLLAFAHWKALAEERRSRLSPPAGLPGRSARLDRRRASLPSASSVSSVASVRDTLPSSLLRHQLRRIVHV